MTLWYICLLHQELHLYLWISFQKLEQHIALDTMKAVFFGAQQCFHWHLAVIPTLHALTAANSDLALIDWNDFRFIKKDMLFLLMHVSKVDKCGDHHVHRPPGRSEMSESRITSTLPPASVSLRCAPRLHPAPCLGGRAWGRKCGKRRKPSSHKPQVWFAWPGSNMRWRFDNQVLIVKVGTDSMYGVLRKLQQGCNTEELGKELEKI